MRKKTTPTCGACGGTVPRPEHGRPARFCIDCRTEGRDHAADYNKSRGYDLALTTTTLRLAVEEATAALEMGRPADALTALYTVEAAGRVALRQDADRGAGRCGAHTDRINHDGVAFERVRCHLPADHYYAERHEGHAVDVGAFQWGTPRAADEAAA